MTFPIYDRKDAAQVLKRLREVAVYDRGFGEFFSTVQRGKVLPGEVLGCFRRDGYLVIGLDGHTYLAHHLVWLWHHERWPIGDLDHVFGDPMDNRIQCLREATRGQNLANAKRPKSNTSGFKGVAWHRRAGRWRAEISIDRRRRYLGLFDTPEQAHAAYMAAAREARGSFARAA
ncbi:MAG: Fis family transcriptional regulator [Stutzerimonas stutzeri]|nr:MAG: Fis family transcriptional regulator [Stutzerimonas stutzeri]